MSAAPSEVLTAFTDMDYNIVMANNDVMPWLIPAHAAIASVALFLGAAQLLRKRKGDRQHRMVGRIWVIAMYITVISSFFIKELRPGHFSWIHGLSVWTFISLSIALWAALTGRIDTHRNWVIGSYFGLVGAFIGAVAVPVRYLPQMIVHRPAEVAMAAFGCAVVAIAIVRLSRERRGTAAADTSESGTVDSPPPVPVSPAGKE